MDSFLGYKVEEYEKGYNDARMKFAMTYVFLKFIKKLVFERPFFLRALFYCKGYLKNNFIDKNFIKDTDLIYRIRKFHLKRTIDFFKII